MTATLRFRVVGEPGPQGSKRHVGKGVMVESSAKVKPWRQDVVAAAETAAAEQDWQAPPVVRAVAVFSFRRPKSHYGTGRNAAVLKSTAPHWHNQKPDVDKLCRSTFDALTTAGVIGDDCRIAHVDASKVWADANAPTGAYLILTNPTTEGLHA
jgi:crossover junction endodeoxyribonuclease RusA